MRILMALVIFMITFTSYAQDANGSYTLYRTYRGTIYNSSQVDILSRVIPYPADQASDSLSLTLTATNYKVVIITTDTLETSNVKTFPHTTGKPLPNVINTFNLRTANNKVFAIRAGRNVTIFPIYYELRFGGY